MKKELCGGMLLAVAGFSLLVGNAFATPVNVSGDNGELTLNEVFTSEGWTIDANADQNSYDDYWQASAGTSSGSWASMIIEIAGNATSNIFGIFDGDGNTLDLLSGAMGAGDKVALAWDSGGLLSATLFDWNGTSTAISILAQNYIMNQTFGFYLDGPAGKFYSDDSMNPGGATQMVSYAGTGVNGLNIGYNILAFEDTILRSSDWDYNDMVLLVESVQPVPEPASMLLFGSGLVGLAGVIRRKIKK